MGNYERLKQLYEDARIQKDERDRSERKIHRDKIEREREEKVRIKSLNLQRLNRLGVVDLFEEIKEKGLDGKHFETHINEENTEIRLVWDIIEHSWNNENFWTTQEVLVASIDPDNNLRLVRNDTISIVKDRLEEHVIQKIFEINRPKSTETQFKRSWLDKLLNKINIP